MAKNSQQKPEKCKSINSNLEKIITGMNKEEQQVLYKQLKSPEPQRYNSHKHYYGERKARLGIISDTHIGSKFFRPDILEKSVEMFNKKKVDAIYHCGDIIEGMSNREGHIYELETFGVSPQVNQAADLLNQYKQPLNFILGNHDEWSMRKSNQGVHIGKMLEEKIKNSKYLGDYEANINLSDNVMMRITHDGNGAYALSYPLQKRINALSDEQKPDILANGHLHKSLYMNYRDINAVEASTMQEQTPFMARKGSPAMTGFWIFDIGYTKKKGLTSFSPTFYPVK